MDEAMCGPCDSGSGTRDKEIPYARRKQILDFSVKLSEQIREHIKSNELCLLKSFVSNLLERNSY